jgi:hypothetical protein
MMVSSARMDHDAILAPSRQTLGLPLGCSRGERKLDPVSERNLVERRFAAPSMAVREHEARVRKQPPGLRPCDAALYRRLRQIPSTEPTVLPEPEAGSGR